MTVSGRFVVAVSFVLLLLQVAQGITSPPSRPDFPYVTDSFTRREVGSCVDTTRVWIYEPEFPDDPPASPPNVVVYLHGFSLTTPRFYQGHIEHLVRQGNVVIFPQFQEAICGLFDGFVESLVRFIVTPSSPVAWSETTVAAVDDALATLSGGYNNIYLFGHSLGGAFGMMWGDLDSGADVTAAVLASPQPAGFGANPDFVMALFSFRFGEDIDVVAAAPQTTFPITVLHFNDDTTAPLSDIQPSFAALGSADKEIYQAQTDRHGFPDLTAEHMTPLTLLSQNSYDWRYVWSALDQVILQNAAPADLVFDMGQWSDGRPVENVIQV